MHGKKVKVDLLKVCLILNINLWFAVESIALEYEYTIDESY